MLSYKVFVRQSADNPESAINKYKGELNFCGDEARKAYNDIIADPCSRKPKNFPSRAGKSSSFVKIKTKKCTELQQVNITANAILKSIDQIDWNFIKQNVTKENVNITDNYGWTPLMLAAYNGNSDIVKYLLTLGADKSFKEKSGYDALQLAGKKHHDNIISLLEGEDPKAIVDNYEKSDQNHVKSSAFYCSVCKINFQETTVKKHESSLLHIFNTNPKLPDPIYGIPKGNKGYQIMLNTGWEESKGLGPSGSGLKYPVKTVLKRDRKGFGGNSEARPRITHFESNAVAAIKDVRQERVMREKGYRKKDREKFLSREARKERAIRQALS